MSSTRTRAYSYVTIYMHDLRDLRGMCIVVSMTTQMDWVPDTEEFSVRLALIRHRLRWNVKEAAIACGIKPQSWREWELHGRRPQDYEGTCKQIAQTVQCNLVWLMTGYRTPPEPPHPTGTSRRGGQLLRFPKAARQSNEIAEQASELVGVDDDAARYVALSEDEKLPRLDSNQQPFGCRFGRGYSQTGKILPWPHVPAVAQAGRAA